MSVRLLMAPAGKGKTAYAVAEARRQARSLTGLTHVLVASALQARAFRRRLAAAGGAMAVRVLTFDELYRTCLSEMDQAYTEIGEPVQHRVIRSVLRDLSLAHYKPVQGEPGFVVVLKRLIDELKAGGVDSGAFLDAIEAYGAPPRLRELGVIYAAYQTCLEANGWADPAGLGWLAAEQLEDGDTRAGADWPLLLVDGFDDFTSVQLRVLASLAQRVDRLVITLTGDPDGERRSLAHRRFERTRRHLIDRLGVIPEPLSEAGTWCTAALAHLEAQLFKASAQPSVGDGSVQRVEATNREREVRAALRWAKAELVERGLLPSQLAILARDVAPYRPFINEIAAEFALPVHVYTGHPLGENPAVAGLMDLLRLMLPDARRASNVANGARAIRDEERGQPSMPPRLVIEAWRSPYFDWSAAFLGTGSDGREDGASIGIGPGDAEALGALARQGRVIKGLSQWEEAFDLLIRAQARNEAEVDDADEPGRVSRPPNAPRAQRLRESFSAFVERFTPPQGRQSIRTFVGWFESLIGSDPEAPSSRGDSTASRGTLRVIARVRGTAGRTGATTEKVPLDGGIDLVSASADRDLAALECLKQVLRGLVWAEKALGDPPVTFPAFFEELSSGVAAAYYTLPPRGDGEEILVADLVSARGIPFRSVAVLGLAEEFFPATQSEDPLLWDSDREELNLPLRPSTESAEAEYFYETVAAPTERLLITRPRLTDDGAPWQASPFWEEVGRLLAATPETDGLLSTPGPHRAASWPELIQASVEGRERPALQAWLRQHSPDTIGALDRAAEVLVMRCSQADTPFDGGLTQLGDHFARVLNRDYVWSASRLESYRTCPFFFFVGKVLGLEPREEPSEGIDWVHRGNLYHEILERVYQFVQDPSSLEQLLVALPQVADAVLDAAPENQRFRRTAWWDQTREELVDDVRQSLRALHAPELCGEFVPCAYEAAFGLRGMRHLIVEDPVRRDAFQLRGLIDRVDRSANGEVRIIDYKTAGPSGYGDSAVRAGERIQLPLYALAARDALGLGAPVSGFYWHVRHAAPSPFRLEKFGVDDAIGTAVAHAWEAVRSARVGSFTPRPPRGGCPSYCPAAGFCWHYQGRYGS